jgi:hypothetical protein
MSITVGNIYFQFWWFSTMGTFWEKILYYRQSQLTSFLTELTAFTKDLWALNWESRFLRLSDLSRNFIKICNEKKKNKRSEPCRNKLTGSAKLIHINYKRHKKSTNKPKYEGLCNQSLFKQKFLLRDLKWQLLKMQNNLFCQLILDSFDFFS